MTHAFPNPEKARAEREELQRLRDLRQRLDTETSDPETRAVLDEFAGEESARAALTLDDIKAGRYSADELSHRTGEITRLLDAKQAEAKPAADITADDLRRMDAEAILRAFPDNVAKALEIINAAEADR